jgi:hypothetical protein
VYCDKPPARTPWEIRLLAQAAKYKVARQTGNQGYSNEGTQPAGCYEANLLPPGA